MPSIEVWLTIANLILLIFGSLGGILAFRSALAKAESDVQERVRDALSAENELLQSRVNRLEKEDRRKGKIIQLIISTLKKTHAIDLDIDEEMVILRTPSGTHVVRIDTSA